jgi:hypothetical protein
MEELRACSKCGETKPISDYPLNKGKPRRFCRTCLNRHQREHNRKNPAKRRVIWHRWADKDRAHVNALARDSRTRQDPKRLSARQKELRDPRREELRQADRDRYWADPVASRAKASVKQKRVYWKDVRATRAKKRAWYAAHKNYFLSLCHAYRVRQAGASGRYSDDDLLAILKAQRGKCAYCKKDIKKVFEVDHIIPVAKGGSNARRNIQLTCVHHNRSKGAKDPLDFARSLNLLL